jgi:hypothetical protein
MRRIVVFAFMLLCLAGMSYALVKVPITTTKLNVTPIFKVNITTNQSNDTSPQPMIKPELISDVPKKLPKNDTTEPCVTCGTVLDISKIPVTEILVPVPCDPSEVGEYLHHTSYYGHSADFDQPDYLEESHEDCDLFGRDDEISQDLDAKLAVVDLIELEINAVESESQDLLDRGKDAVECLREAEHGLEAASSNPSFASLTSIGGPYPSGGIFSYVVNQLRIFHYAYENVHTGYNYSNASMENLVNITLGLEDMCRRRVCVFPEKKEYYEDLLEHEQREASYYANRTKYFIDDVRDFAQNYHDLKGGIDRDECIDFVAQSTQYAPWQNMNYENFSQNESPKIIAPIKIAKNFPGVKNVTLVGGEKPKYVIQSKQKKKLLWLFEVQMETKTELNAQNGQIIKEEKPWWSFLVGE